MGGVDMPVFRGAAVAAKDGPAPAQDVASAADGAGAERASIAGLAPPTLVHSKARRRSIDITLRITGPLALLLLWWFASYAHWVSPQVAVGPGTVGSTFWDMLLDGQLWSNLSASLSLAFTGLALGGSIGLVLGLLTGLTRLGDELIDPVVQMLRTIPFIALSPLLIVWFGIGTGPKVILIALASAFPLYLNVHSGVHNVDRKIIEAARVYGVSRLRLIWEIVLPNAVPSLLVGLRMALTISLLALVFAEQINTTRGIGYLLTTAESYFETNIMFVCVALYAVWGLLADLLVRLLQRLLMPWQYAARGSRRAAQ